MAKIKLATMQKAVHDYCSNRGCYKCKLHPICSDISIADGEGTENYKKRFYSTLYAALMEE